MRLRLISLFMSMPLLSLVLMMPPALAQDQSQAQAQATAPLPTMAEIEKAWADEDYETARTGLARLATETGTALAQYRYGRILLEGRGGDQDIDAAVIWLTRAADQNNVAAATLLARIYLSEFDQDAPVSTQRDPARAAALLGRAAALGGAEAQFQLARLYGAGVGVEKNAETAFTWLLAAARQEYVPAQYALSNAYARGTGVAQNAAEAITWLTRAADNNHLRAQFFLGRAYETGNGVKQNAALAADWYERAATGGLATAQRRLGAMYLNGAGVPTDPARGLTWLRRAADAGASEAMVDLGRAYAAGTGVTQDDVQAALWYARAVEYGQGPAMVSLAAMHEAGRGVGKDFDRAVVLYLKALETSARQPATVRLGQLAATGQLGTRYAPQRMVPWVLAAWDSGDAAAQTWLETQAAAGLRDARAGLATRYLTNPDTLQQGAVLLEQAATAGDAEAQMRLGQLYMTGGHGTLDYVAAYKWFNIAATLGMGEAGELRTTASALMTPDQVAQAQEATRQWFAHEEPQPPATKQTVKVTK